MLNCSAMAEQHILAYTMCPLDFILSTNLTKSQAYRPMLRLTLSNGPHRISCFGFVDSAADSCSFPRKLMEPLGINTEQIIPTMGVGSTNQTYIHPVTINIADIKDIEPFSIKAGFLDGLNEWVYEGLGVGLLGQVGFFDHFKVSLDYRGKSFIIESYA